MPANSRYDFILKTGNKSKLPKISTGGIPKPAKIALIVLGVASVLIIGLAVISALSSSPENIRLLRNVAVRQAQILQAAEIGVEKARSQETRNLATTTRVSLVGDQQPLLTALEEQNINVSAEDDPDFEQRFTEAEQLNRLDDELLSYLRSELTAYAEDLRTAYNTTESSSLKEVLSAQYENALVLSGQNPDEQ